MMASHAKGTVARPSRLLVSDTSILCPASRKAFERFTVEGLGAQPVVHAAHDLPCTEIYGHELAHSSVFLSAGKPGWPASVIHQ